MMITKCRVALMAAVLGASVSARAGVFTIAGQTFDTDNTAQSASIVEGSVNIQDYSSKIFARIELEAAGTGVNEFIIFDRGRTVGRLMGRQADRPDDRARFISFPEKGVRGGQPNRDRVTIQLTWGKYGIPNTTGPDLAVYENGNYEPFQVSVRKRGALDFTPYRYHHLRQTDTSNGVNLAVFDFSLFGLAEGDVVEAVRIRNTFNSEAKAGADKVDSPLGEGRVIYPDDPQYATANKLTNGVGGREYPTQDLDADIVYVVGLQKIVPLSSVTGAGASSSNN